MHAHTHVHTHRQTDTHTHTHAHTHRQTHAHTHTHTDRHTHTHRDRHTHTHTHRQTHTQSENDTYVQLIIVQISSEAEKRTDKQKHTTIYQEEIFQQTINLKLPSNISTVYIYKYFTSSLASLSAFCQLKTKQQHMSMNKYIIYMIFWFADIFISDTRYNFNQVNCDILYPTCLHTVEWTTSTFCDKI